METDPDLFGDDPEELNPAGYGYRPPGRGEVKEQAVDHVLIPGKDGVAICLACQRSYIPDRRPDPTRRNYCPSCGRRAAVRDASRAYRERKRTEPDEAKEQAISDLLEKIANLPGITPEDLELLEEITGNGK
jgi:hypothetical protein